MCTLKRLLAALVIGIVGSLALSAQLLAQAWPQRTVRVIVPLPPGTGRHGAGRAHHTRKRLCAEGNDGSCRGGGHRVSKIRLQKEEVGRPGKIDIQSSPRCFCFLARPV